MILLLFLQIQLVIMEVTKCEIVQDYPDILYPSNMNQFVQPLDDYFHGEGLTYSVNGTTIQFGVSQSISVTQQTQPTKYAFPANTVFIDDAAQYNWTNPNYQTGSFVALVEYDSNYYLYETSFSGKTQTWSRITMAFTSTQTALCTNVAYFFENDFLVSCMTRAEGFQIFYYFQRVQAKIFTKYIPGVLIRVDTTIFQLNNAEFSYLQIFNDKGKKTYVTVAHANYYHENTVIFVFFVTIQRSIKEPLKFEHHYVGQHARAAYGAYLANSQEIYILFDDILVLHNFRRILDYKDGYPVTSAQGMGVYKETYTDDSYNVFITVVTTTGLVHFSTSNLQSNQQPALPQNLITNKRLAVKVSSAYTLVSDGSTLAVYANRFNLKENKNQYGFLYSKEFTINNILFIFDTLGSNFNVYDNSFIYTYQIQVPYLYSLATLATDYGVEQSFQVQATAQNGKICQTTITYELLNPTTITDFVALSTRRQREEPYLLFNSQSKLVPVSDQFIGANIKYVAYETQILPDPDPNDKNETIVEEQQRPTVTVLQNNVIDIVQNSFQVSFAYTYQVDDDTYLLFTQVTTALQLLQIQKCKFIACIETYQFQTGINQQIISISASKSGAILHVAFGSLTDIITVDLQYSNMNTKEQLAHIKLQEKTKVPTIQLTNLQFLGEALLVLTNTPNSIICYNTLLREQYILDGNELSPRQIFINNYIYNDTYFVDNQYELIVIQHTKNLEVKEFTEVKYSYNVLAAFNYPNNYKQQQISVGVVRRGFYLIQVTAQRQNVYFYPYTFLYYYMIDSSKIAFMIQLVPISQFGVTIAQPFVTGTSGQDHFYVSVTQNSTGKNQVIVLRNSPYEFDQLYQILNIQISPSIFCLASINRQMAQFREDDLQFEYDVLLIQSSAVNQLIAIQIFKETMVLFTPNVQVNRLDLFEVSISATAQEETKIINREFQVTKQALGIIERTNEVINEYEAVGSIFFMFVNPADYFYGYASNYTVLNKIGLRLDLQDVYVDCIQKQKQHKIIQNGVILPIIHQDAKYNLTFSSATSGIIAGTDYVQSFLQSGRSMYILFNLEAFFLYQVPAPLTSVCQFSFISSDTGYLVTLCTTADDTFFYYYNGTDSSNRTMMAYSAYQLIDEALPDLLDVEFSYNILALNYLDFIVMMNISITNASMTVNNHTKFKYSYPVLSTSLFVVSLDELENQDPKRDDHKNVTAFMEKLGAGMIILYPNGLLQFQYIDKQGIQFSVFASYLTQLPNGIKVLSVSAFSYGWIANTYMSVPFLVATSSSSYLFQITLPIVQRGGSGQTYLIYTLIPYDRYKTTGVYVSGNSITGVFYTDSNQDGFPEYVVGLYGVPTLKNFAQDKTLQAAFDPNKVYQHAGTSIGFIGIQNLTNQTISNVVVTANKTMFYLVNYTTFSYIYLSTQLRLTINQVECINTSSIHHALNSTKIELIATNNLTTDISRNSFYIKNEYPPYTFMVTEERRRNFWWQFGFGVVFFCIITGVLTYLCFNSNKIIVYQERLIQVELNE